MAEVAAAVPASRSFGRVEILSLPAAPDGASKAAWSECVAISESEGICR